MTENGILLELRQAGFRYPGNGAKVVFEELNFSVKRGESVALLGPNGCGKTTLLNVAFGIVPATEGDVIYAGEVVKSALTSGSIVFQSDCLMPWRTVYQNISFALECLLPYPQNVKDRIFNILDEMRIADSHAKYPHQLSGGMRQKVALARALITAPEIIFLDEPYSSLDAPTREHLQEEIAREREKKHFTTLIVTHDIDEAIFLADRCIVMSSSPMKPIKEFYPGFGLERPGELRKSIEFAEMRTDLWAEMRKVCQNTREVIQ